jgi:ATP-dependent Lon protease
MNLKTKYPEIFDKSVLPMVPLREMVPFISDFPLCPLKIGREKSKKALEKAGVTNGSGLVFLCTKKNSEIENPSINDLYEVGMIALAVVSSKAMAAINTGEGTYNILHGGVYPAKLLSLYEEDGAQIARIEPFSPWFPDETVGQHWEKVSEVVAFARTTDLAQNDLISLWGEDQQSSQLMNFCYNLLVTFDYKDQQELLDSKTPVDAIELCFLKLKNKYQI